MYTPIPILKQQSNLEDIEAIQKVAKKLYPIINNYMKETKKEHSFKSCTAPSGNDQIAGSNQASELRFNKTDKPVVTSVASSIVSLVTKSLNLISDELREEILNWLFTKPLEERVRVCSIHNKWLVEIMKTLMDGISNGKILSKIQAAEVETKDNVSDYEIEKKNMSGLTFTFLNKKLDPEPGEFEISKRENFSLFLSKILILLGENIVFSKELLESKSNFFDFLSALSDNLFLSSLIQVTKPKNSKLYSIELPKWTNQQIASQISLEIMIIGFLDQIIQIKYFLEKSKFPINDFKIYTIEIKQSELASYFNLNKQAMLDAISSSNILQEVALQLKSANEDSSIDVEAIKNWVEEIDAYQILNSIAYSKINESSEIMSSKMKCYNMLIELHSQTLASELIIMEKDILSKKNERLQKMKDKKKNKKDSNEASPHQMLQEQIIKEDHRSADYALQSGYNTASDYGANSSASTMTVTGIQATKNILKTLKRSKKEKKVQHKAIFHEIQEKIDEEGTKLIYSIASNNLNLVKYKQFNEGENHDANDLDFVKKVSTKSKKNCIYQEDEFLEELGENTNSLQMIKKISKQKKNDSPIIETFKNNDKEPGKSDIIIGNLEDNSSTKNLVNPCVNTKDYYASSNVKSMNSNNSISNSGNNTNAHMNPNSSYNSNNGQKSHSMIGIQQGQIRNKTSFLPKNGSLFQNFHYFPNQTQDFIFKHKLHCDILEITNETEINLSLLMPYKQLVLNNLREEVGFILNREVEFEVFGSFAVGFSIECSDIDLCLKLNEAETMNNLLCESYKKLRVETDKSYVKILESKLNFDNFVNSLANGIKNFGDFFNSFVSNTPPINYKILNFYEEVTPIVSASVPVIKLTVDLSQMLNRNDYLFLMNNLSSYMFPTKEFLKIKIDISFNKYVPGIPSSYNRLSFKMGSKGDLSEEEHYLTDKEKEFPKPVKIISKSNTPTVDFVRSALMKHKEIKPLILILKRILQVCGLNNPFKGGLSSYSLFLMILTFLSVYSKKELSEQSIIRESNLPFLGCILIEFFEFYGNLFDFDSIVVNPKDESQPFMSLECLEKLVFHINVESKKKRKMSYVSSQSKDSCFEDDDINEAAKSNPNFICFQNWNHIIVSRAIIIDPISFTNVSQSSFNIQEVQQLFSELYIYLTKHRDMNIEYDFNIIRNLYSDLLPPKQPAQFNSVLPGSLMYPPYHNAPNHQNAFFPPNFITSSIFPQDQFNHSLGFISHPIPPIPQIKGNQSEKSANQSHTSQKYSPNKSDMLIQKTENIDPRKNAAAMPNQSSFNPISKTSIDKWNLTAVNYYPRKSTFDKHLPNK